MTFDVNYKISLEEGQALYQNQQQAALSALAQRGIMVPNGPPVIMTQAGPQPYQGELPQSLTTLTDEQLGELLNSIARWQEFVQTDLAAAQMSYDNAQIQLEQIEAQLRMIYKYDEGNKKRTEQERKDLMVVDRRYAEARARLFYYECVYRIIKALAHAADKKWDTVSRRITQRQQEIDRGRREVSVGQPSPVFRRP